MSDYINERAKERSKEFCRKYTTYTYEDSICKYAKLRMSVDKDVNWEDEILENPYILMRANGIGFKRADSIAEKIGYDMTHKNRILASVPYVMENMTKGSTILPIMEVLNEVKKLLNINDDKKVMSTVLFESDGEYLLLTKKFRRTKEIQQVYYITKTEWYDVEKGFFNLINKISKSDLKLAIDENKIDKIKSSLKFKLNEGQEKAVKEILSNTINIFTGYGGTGKTFTLKVILDILKAHKQSITCLAPTGIASKVFTNSTGYECSTIHRLFYNNGIICSDWLVIDESSMLSIDHIQLLLRMIQNKDNIKLIFIGDLNQLTPISAGSIFRDMFSIIGKGKIKGNISRLTEIMRASSETFIPHLCKEFTEGYRYNYKHEKEENPNVYFYPLKDNVVNQIVEVMDEHNFNFENTYIITPKNIGKTGANIINEGLDNLFGGSIIYDRNKKYIRENSYVMNIKNNPSKNIYNGERMQVKYFDDNKIYFRRLDENEELVYDKNEVSTYVSLSYALTAHKSQGITSENVIFIASKNDTFMLNSNLTYTALSRASKKLVILYEEGILSLASSKKIIEDRRTFLGEFSKL